MIITLASVLFRDDSGQDVVEYVLILLMLAIAATAALDLFGGEVDSAYQNAADEVNRVTGGGGG